MINLRCILFGHKFAYGYWWDIDMDIPVGNSSKKCIHCGLTKEECGIKLKSN